MALFKYIVLSVCLCGIHLNGFAPVSYTHLTLPTIA